uniref:Conotoxin LiC53 n=1 Tax=Conus lividus TaxID=89426 RepID=O265_CONLI|nr:RecName: Full=Conotoxin LiC53; Flags: Precursor [Conus lividus]AAZ83756.1 LiC53P [Conus lividus]
MEKLTSLLLVAALLMLTQTLIQGGGEDRPNKKFLQKIKSTAKRECTAPSGYCDYPEECCEVECGRHYCDWWY